LFGSFYFLVHGFAYISALNEVPIRTKETGVFAWASEGEIRSFYFSEKEWSFDIKDCSGDRGYLMHETRFNKLEVDVLCNSLIKFDVFLQKALEQGFDKIAMGHYARIQESCKED